MWVAGAELPRSAGNPFQDRLNRVLDDAGFDAFVEEQCAKFYADGGVGRPSLAPGRYFRMLMLGYFEGLDSERAITRQAADSLSFREFLDVALHEASPDHSTVSRTRWRIDLETHQAAFTWVLQRLSDAGFVKAKTIGIHLQQESTPEAPVHRELQGVVARGHAREGGDAGVDHPRHILGRPLDGQHHAATRSPGTASRGRRCTRCRAPRPGPSAGPRSTGRCRR